MISKTALLAETGLKVLAAASTLDSNDLGLSKNNAGELFIIFHAQVNFQQYEYCNLVHVVRSTPDEETGRLFGQFENISQALSERLLSNREAREPEEVFLNVFSGRLTEAMHPPTETEWTFPINPMPWLNYII